MKKKLSPQCKKIVALLKKQYSTTLDIIIGASSTSPHRRLTEIKEAGYTIKDRWMKTKNGKRVKEYRIR